MDVGRAHQPHVLKQAAGRYSGGLEPRIAAHIQPTRETMHPPVLRRLLPSHLPLGATIA